MQTPLHRPAVWKRKTRAPAAGSKRACALGPPCSAGGLSAARSCPQPHTPGLHQPPIPPRTLASIQEQLRGGRGGHTPLPVRGERASVSQTERASERISDRASERVHLGQRSMVHLYAASGRGRGHKLGQGSFSESARRWLGAQQPAGVLRIVVVGAHRATVVSPAPKCCAG